ncbi:DUF6334 family protein [Asticcacaulis sp.]|uniref:DUF6334 family protein n=1 Tax=Asticcacaulis sp. TaxID=1872648 RepID=UPI002625259F|nr:DUF6334 family protein [Asticcacaulis sp.]
MVKSIKLGTESSKDIYLSMIGSRIISIFCNGRLKYNDGTVRWDCIVFELENLCVSFTVDSDSDELLVEQVDCGFDKSEYEKLSGFNFKGHDEIDWIWEAKNNFGFFDSLIFSTNNGVPKFGITSIGSQIIFFETRFVS